MKCGTCEKEYDKPKIDYPEWKKGFPRFTCPHCGWIVNKI
jgi:hypothetical protein